MRPSERQTTWCLTIEQVAKTKEYWRRDTVIADRVYMELGKAYCSQHAGRVGDVFDHEDSAVSP